jgi:tetratricopeptide (TPR) repeat protein
MMVDAVAQSASARSEERRSSRSSSGANANQNVMFPDATREAPGIRASSRLGRKLQRMIDAFNKAEYPQTRALADEVLADDGANAYEKSLAGQLAGQAAYSLDDEAAAERYLEQALSLNGLDNNGHYQSMLMLAQLQLQDETQQQAGLALLDRYLTETRSQKPQDLVLKGQALYQMQRYQEAIPLLRQAIDASSEPNDSWNQLLMVNYLESDQPDQAVSVAEQLATRRPDDKSAQLNLASVYMQAEKPQQAVQVLERLRASGQLTEEREFRQLYVTYANMDGHENDVISVINEGMRKGALKPDYQSYLALAQSYYYSDRIPQAIENWEKAAPLSDNGETYLNLARVLWQEDRIPEAKQAAQHALDRGVRNPADAQRIINLK